MADCPLSYHSVCERTRISLQRNERTRREAERLQLIFKPVNMERLETLKKQYLTYNQSGFKHQKSNTIKLSFSSSNESHTQYTYNETHQSNDSSSSMDEEINELLDPVSSSSVPPLSIIPTTLSTAINSPISTVSSTLLVTSSLFPITPSYTQPVSVLPVSTLPSLSLIAPSSSVSPQISTLPSTLQLFNSSETIAPMSTILPSNQPVFTISPSTVTVSTSLSSSSMPSSTLPVSTVLPFGQPGSTIPSSTISVSTVLPSSQPLSTVTSTLPFSISQPMSTVALSTLPVSTVMFTNQPVFSMLPFDQPVSIAPSSTLPVSMDSSSMLPVSTVPSFTLPVSTVPSSTLPVSTVPSSTLPVSTVPSSTLPVSTVPSPTLLVSTVPSSTLPVSTVPSSTLPVSTVPSSTLPVSSSTLPVSTVPLSTLPVSTSAFIPPLSSAPFSAVITQSTTNDSFLPIDDIRTETEDDIIPNNVTNNNTVDQLKRSSSHNEISSAIDNKDNESESDFWDNSPKEVPLTVSIPSQQVPVSTVISNESSSDDNDTNDIDYSSTNIISVTITLLHTINSQVRKDHKLAQCVYESPSDMKSHLQHSTVLNSLLTKRAELGKDLMTWDTATLAAVFLDSLSKIVTIHGPPPLQSADLKSLNTEGWSSMWPLILAHVRLLFQCGMLLDKISDILSPILQSDRNTLLVLFQEECGAEIIFSRSSSIISELTNESNNDDKFQAMYHSLVQSSRHTDDSNDSLSEGSAVAVLKTNIVQTTDTLPTGGMMGGLHDDNNDDDGSREESDISLPLPQSPPPLHKLSSPPPVSPPSDESSQLSRSSSLRQRRSGLDGIINRNTLQKRMGNNNHDGVEDIISSPLSGPSVNSDDDFDFYN